jgi:ABC-type Zn uptake system ZnuABC Zn-binding protein ZnuA
MLVISQTRFHLLALLLLSAACAPRTTTPLAAAPTTGTVPITVPWETPAAKLRVVATTTQINVLTQIVAGNKIELAGILKANVDAHDYEPTPEDARNFANAQLIFVNGIGLEDWLDKLIKNSGTRAVIVQVSRNVTIRKVKDLQGKEEPDPHIWHSVPNAIIMLHNIRDELARRDAANAETFKSSAAAYESKLNDLDKYIMAQIATIPAANRKLVTNHDALGYYAARYGLTFVGSIIPSMDTNYQPAPKELADLVKVIKAQKVEAIFIESSIKPALAQQIAKEAGVRVVDGVLYGDALGPPGSNAETLDGMLKANTDLIVSNLK